MSLPMLAVPEDTITLLSIPKPVTYRPYLVGEEKILLMAQAAQEQNKDTKEVEKAIKQIIQRCTFQKIDVDALPSFDIEYLFLQLRAKSVNNIIHAQFRCKHVVDEKPCDTLVPVTININDIKLTVPEGHSKKVMLSDTIGVTMKYPTAAVYEDYLSSPNQLGILEACLDTVFTVGGEVNEVKEQPPAEVKRFIESLTLGNVEKIRTFFETMPRLAYTFNFKCPACGYAEDVTLQGLTDFFD